MSGASLDHGTGRRRCRVTALAFAALVPLWLAMVTTVAQARDTRLPERVERRPGTSDEALARSVLPAGASLAHPPVRVDLGASTLGKALVALYRPKDGTTYSGAVLLPDAGSDGRLRVTALPDVREADGLFDLDVMSVFTTPTANEDRRSLVVLYRYYRLGSGETPRHAGYVYARADSGWTIDDAGTRRLVGARDARQARAKLKAGSPQP
jgi:hypothetical protein